ncbi:ATPase AAA [Marinitoga sp. 1135]|uniref:Uridine kinase n=1 Tax=Marinitoga piezophila (strain DSM 14283 / JCM 11233 / KA3) TaxID=443254 RepID=H2J5A7_MARPK|nr:MULTISPECIES: nucleoside kinase [Marinitoga]AEX84965.1 uridine kinase [Marinitoga piezophila KA3]APT75472.1 ATPase AAA [Marinitoga sp. 1137]NUU95196.1 ATPase AAA [Marinitoga sp. 1135]NUU97128.1 ATPase AAA [Marinitoga sp. 1138]
MRYELKIKDKILYAEKGTKYIEIIRKIQKEHPFKILAVKHNNNIKELLKEIEDSGEIVLLDTSTLDGFRIYQRGVLFLLYMALKDLYPEDKLYVHHSIGSGLYCELRSGKPSQKKLEMLKEKMLEYVKEDLPFEKKTISKFRAIKMFENVDLVDKSKLFKYRKKDKVNIYICDKYFNYFYGYMPPSTGYVDLFDLKSIDDGFVVLHPTPKSPDKVPEYKHYPKLSYTFNEYKEWLKILEVSTVGELNSLIAKGPEEATELIRVSEALHEKKYAQIADEIIKRKNIKVVLIAGPSSSGKTTSAKRLALQLKVNGLKPIPISLDDYFVDREKTPRDENGNYDFESIYALDLDLFNTHLSKLLKGEEIELPKFDFVHGKRVWSGNKIKMEEDQVLIIEGIHGLNELLTESIPREFKYKIYVSALTQMNLDSMNRITTTDTRLIRRIVRDFNFRGHSALATLKMWPSVRRGEDRNIFPFQEEADIMFNSNLIYELSVLKIFAEPLLLMVDNSNPEYSEAKRLLKFLDYFLPITVLEEIPRKSILREFIGRSTFKY